MKKLLTILILLMAVVSQGWAVDAITTLYPLPHDVGNWNSLQIDYDLVSEIQSGDKITIYINKDDRNHNIQVQYEKPKEVGEGNDWTGIGIDLATETEGEIYSITMTETAAGYFNETTKSKLILTGENYTVTKVTLTHDDTPKQLFPKTVINGWGNISISKDLFTNAVVNDIVKAEFSESVSSAELKFLYGWGSGEEYTITTDETSKIVSLTIASEEILNKLKGNDLLISPRSGNSVSIRDVKIVPTYQLSVSVENGKLYLGDTETEYTNNTRYESGSTVTLRAVANEGYRFVNWKNGDDIVSETASYTTPALSADLTLTANFIQQFTVTTASADTNKGTVAITNADANNKYDAGSTVTVTAAAASDSYEFDKWTKTGDDNWNSSDAATVNPLSISELAADWALTASFKEKTKDTPEINLSAFSAGDDATLNAGVFTTTANSKTISQWIGDNSGVTGNKLVVKFAGTPTGGEGQSVKVAAEYIATEYEEAYAYPDANNIAVVNLDNSKYIKSIYIQLAIPGSVTVNSVALDPLYTITATSANNEQGSVGVTTEPTSDGKYAHGTEVTVTATPQSGYSFLQWKVGETSVSTDASYTFTATEDVALTADFKGVKTLKQASQPMLGENLDTHVTVAKTAFTNATAGDILVINMSETAEGATITLKQNGEGSPASYNYITANYSEALTEGQTTYQVTLTSGILAKLQEQGLYITGEKFTCGNIALVTNGDVTTDAAHVTQYLLTITQPSEGGTIKIGDNNAASKAYTSGTEVSLTATPATNYKFVKWTKDSEDLTETTNPITLTVTANTSIAATFKQMHSVTAVSESDAKGTVAVTNPADDNLYDTGSTITVTATPKSGYEFEKWTKTENASWSSTNNPLNIEDLSADWTLTASFTDATFTAPEGETVLSSESTVVGNWGGTSIPTETYNTYKQGDVIKVYVKAVLDNAKVVIQEQQGWSNVTEESIDATTTVYSYTVTASENLAKMNSSGLKITGENYTIWGVTIIPAVIPVKNLSTGSTKINGSTSVVIHKEMFANAAVGDVITIHVSELAPAGENTKAKYGLSGAGENETGDNWGWIEGNDLAEDATAITRTITTEDLTILKDAGLKIAGEGIYVCGDVTLTTNGEVPEAQTHSSPSFTLTVNEPIGGTIAIKKDSETVSAGAFDIDTELTLTATAANGYTFLKWQKNGEDAGTDATLSITMSANTEITALFQGAPLEYEEKRTLFEGSVDINWSGVAIQPSTVGAILEAGEQLILTTTVAEGAYGQVVIRGADRSDAIEGSAIGGLVNGENVITLTSAMVEAMREEFGFWGADATLTKVVLYKPVTVFSEAGVADLITMTESEGKSTLAVPHEESLKGNVLVVESTEDATVTVTYTDNTTATNKAGNRKVGTSAASEALVLLNANKYIAKIEVNKAKSVISKIYTATLPVFEADGDNYAADLAMATADAGVLYDTSSFTIAVSSGWKGISLTSTEGETVKGAEISLTFGSEAKVKTTAYYTDGTDTGETGIMSEAATVQKLAIDNTKTIKSISIQPQEAGAVQLKEVKVNAEATPDPAPTPEQTGVNISLAELNEGWSSTYDATSKTITTEGEWAARGWYIGDDRYNNKGSITVKFNAVEFPVTLKMEYTNANDEAKDVSAGAAAGETEVTLDIPANVKTIDKVYITYEKAATLKLTAATVNDPVVDNRTEKTLVEKTQAIADGDIEINRGLFSNAVAGDIIRIYAKDLSATSKIALATDYDSAFDGANWTGFTESPFALKLTASLLSKVQEKNLLIRGENFTFTKAVLYTEKELGEPIGSGGEEPEISNTDASEEAKKLFNVLKDLYGKKIVSGVVANVDWNTKEAENVYKWTGKYPAMNVFDYINLHASKDVNSEGWVDYSDISTAKNWWKEGGIVGAMWHWQMKANNGTDYTCTPGTAADETSFDASKVYVDGTSENTLAKQQLDQLCGYLKKMQDAGIPVVWRPLHEGSGNVEQYTGGTAWFWWGAKGADVYKQLWQWMYNYMVKTKGLNNLIWVWTSQTGDKDWYPGDAYVDIIGRDNYGATAAKLATEYEDLKDAYPNKMITLSECGNSDDDEMATLSSIWNAGSRWSWFMTWYDSDYNEGKTTTHKHTSEAWWKDAVGKDYVVTRDQMKELLGQASSDDSQTGVNISLDDLNEGWSSTYNSSTKTITTEGEWAARGWYIGDDRYNGKGSVTVKYEAVTFGVTLKMEYTNTSGDSKSVSAGAAAGETEVELDIPTDVKTIEKVYITFQPIGTLKLTSATVNDKVVDTRTEKTLVEKEAKIADGDIKINRGLFSNAVAKDVIRIYATGLSDASKIALEPGDYSGAIDGANWTAFTESPFALKLTESVLATIKEKGLLVRGENFTFTKAVLYTEKELGKEIIDVQKYTLTLSTPENGTVVIKKGNEEVKAGEFEENTELTLTATAAEGYEFTKWQKNGEDAGTEATLTVKMTADMTIAAVFSKKTEPIIDEETGETDLTEMTPQDPSTTTVEYNDEDQSITITTTEPYKAAQIWFNEPEKLAKGNVLIVDIAESGVNVTVTVKYTDGTESSMTSTAHAASSRHAAAAGTKISVPLETGKDVQNIEVKNAEAGTITIQKMVVTTKNIFTDGVADLSMAKPQSNAIYDTSTYSLAVTKGWTGITITPLATEQVSGVELMLQFTSAAQVKVAVTYNEGEGPSVIMDEAAKYLQMTLDKAKTVKEIQIQPTAAGVVQFKSLAVNQTVSPAPDYVAPLEEGERRTLFESMEGTQLSWNDICQMAANYGAILEEREQIEVYISARTEDCEWPKVFIKDANGEECGTVAELSAVDLFPYMAKFKLTNEMVEQLRDGFSICGDGIIVTQVCLYKPAALKAGDIDVADLNGGYQSSYDATSKTITTTSRWAARGWDIGDNRYNNYDVVVVQFEAVEFPVTLRMEYVDMNGETKTLSQGASAGNTQVEIEIPDDIQQINYVYLMYENPGTLILTNAEALRSTYRTKTLNLADFEAISDGTTYDNKTFTMTSTADNGTIQLWLNSPIEGGEDLTLTLVNDAAKVSMLVGYTDGSQVSVESEGTTALLPLNHSKNIQKIMISIQTAGTVQFESIQMTQRILTFIPSVKTDIHYQQNDDSWYRLDGKRVSQPGRGIYIHNGKKIVIK